VLSIAHLNHQLRGAESDGDESFVAELAATLKLPFHVSRANAADYAKEKRISLEAAGRQLRYDFFFELVRSGKVNRVATAHTLDDQAETVLLKLVRGAGTRGLAGIYPSLTIPGAGDAAIVRPLLQIRRVELEGYLNSIGQAWREDRSNRDLRHARNRVRHGVLPRLERYLNPSVRSVLAETAEIARAEEDYWQRRVDAVIASAKEALSIDTLTALPPALVRRVIRAHAQALGLHLEFHHVESVRSVLAGEVKAAELPGGWCISRHGNLLCLENPATAPTRDYAYDLPVPGKIDIDESGITLEALVVTEPSAAGYNPEQLLDRSRLDLRLQVRNWRPGDRFWPAHTKAPRKIKELLQDRKIAGREREAWPVIVSGGEVVWVMGFPTPESMRARPSEQAIVIRETRRAPHDD
jgi:tRNA(Ile)-lysidine synthase